MQGNKETTTETTTETITQPIAQAPIEPHIQTEIMQNMELLIETSNFSSFDFFHSIKNKGNKTYPVFSLCMYQSACLFPLQTYIYALENEYEFIKEITDNIIKHCNQGDIMKFFISQRRIYFDILKFCNDFKYLKEIDENKICNYYRIEPKAEDPFRPKFYARLYKNKFKEHTNLEPELTIHAYDENDYHVLMMVCKKMILKALRLLYREQYTIDGKYFVMDNNIGLSDYIKSLIKDKDFIFPDIMKIKSNIKININFDYRYFLFKLLLITSFQFRGYDKSAIRFYFLRSFSYILNKFCPDIKTLKIDHTVDRPRIIISNIYLNKKFVSAFSCEEKKSRLSSMMGMIPSFFRLLE